MRVQESTNTFDMQIYTFVIHEQLVKPSDWLIQKMYSQGRRSVFASEQKLFSLLK